ncbi:MAG: ATP-binding protein [Myxococcota bacterium]
MGGLRRALVSTIATAIGALVLALLLLEDPIIVVRLSQLAQSTLEGALDEAAREVREVRDLGPTLASLGAEYGCRMTAYGADDGVITDTALAAGAVASPDLARQHAEPRALFRAGERVKPRDGDRFLAFRELELGGERIVLQASLSTVASERIREAVRELLVVGGVMAILVAVFLTLALGRSLVQPTRELTTVADALAAGDLSARTRSTRDDELGAIGRALDRMADQLADRIDTLRAEQDRLRTILNSMVEAVFVTDGLGRIAATNLALEELVAGNPIGRTAMEAIRSPELHEAVRAARKGEATTVDLAIPIQGDMRSLAAQVAPLPDGGGVVAVLHDITRLKETDRIRRDFVANASHELRTPLTAIRGFAETLRDGAVSDPEAADRFLDVILKHTLRLQALVADLVALSKAESLEHRLELERVDAAAVLAEVVQGLGAKASERDTRIVEEVHASSTLVLGNARALDQVLVNLVDNAIKYSPEGSVVEARIREDGDRVLVEIYNPGPGIAAKHIDRLFERFYRVDPGRARDVGGTGLGLAIVKHLCSQMGAQVGVESRVGEGATFWVSLASAASAASAAEGPERGLAPAAP